MCVSLDVNFNDSLTNDIVSFEQLGPDHCLPVYLELYSGFIFIHFLRHNFGFVIVILEFISKGNKTG